MATLSLAAVAVCLTLALPGSAVSVRISAQGEANASFAPTWKAIRSLVTHDVQDGLPGFHDLRLGGERKNQPLLLGLVVPKNQRWQLEIKDTGFRLDPNGPTSLEWWLKAIDFRHGNATIVSKKIASLEMKRSSFTKGKQEMRVRGLDGSELFSMGMGKKPASGIDTQLRVRQASEHFSYLIRKPVKNTMFSMFSTPKTLFQIVKDPLEAPLTTVNALLDGEKAAAVPERLWRVYRQGSDAPTFVCRGGRGRWAERVYACFATEKDARKAENAELTSKRKPLPKLSIEAMKTAESQYKRKYGSVAIFSYSITIDEGQDVGLALAFATGTDVIRRKLAYDCAGSFVKIGNCKHH